jgi:hypothetical protein
MKKLIQIALVLSMIFAFNTTRAAVVDTTKLYGVTLDDISKISNIVTALSNLSVKPTARIVFDEWVAASYYVTPVSKIKPVSFIMGEILDSYYMKQYNLQQYTDRVNEYYNALGSKVDIWEVGNEINGEWLGATTDVVAKMTSAYDIIKSKGAKTELTLYYNWNCWSNKNNEMFKWANTNIPARMKTGLDYVLVSYYEDDCNGYQPNWQKVMDSLHVIFPNSKIGIGECGTTKSTKKASYLTRYYNMNITTPNYVGGYFWWYWYEDCVPNTKTLWSTFNNILKGKLTSPGQLSKAEMEPVELKSELTARNYPNPFNPTTKIYYNVPMESKVRLSIFDAAGREVAVLVNGVTPEGSHIVEFDGSALASGVYFYRLETPANVITNKMILLK